MFSLNAALSLSEAPMNWGLCYYYYFRGRIAALRRASDGV